MLSPCIFIDQIFCVNVELFVATVALGALHCDGSGEWPPPETLESLSVAGFGLSVLCFGCNGTSPPPLPPDHPPCVPA